MLTRILGLLKTKHWWIFFALIFGLALLLPISYYDDMYYAVGEGHPFRNNVLDPLEKGSVFTQQINEYLTWHGRFLTHIIVRIVLQTRLLADIFTALIAMLFLSFSAILISPEEEGFPAFPPILWAFLVVFFTVGVWIPMVQLTHFASYRLSFIFIALFILPYLRFLGSSEFKTSPWLVALCGFLAGQTHEQAVVLAPMLLMAALFLITLYKQKIPLWFWVGIITVIMGNIIVLGSPYGRSEQRLIEYGRALDWEFFGQRLNWIALGPMRYLYSLVKVLMLWIPWSILPTTLFIILWLKSARRLGFSSRLLLPSLFMFVCAHAFAVVIMFSPTIGTQTVALGMDTLLVSVFSILTVYGRAAGKNRNFGGKYLPWVYLILLIPLIIQLPASIAYRREHWAFVERLREAKKTGQKEIALRPFQKQGFNTPLGPIRFIYPPEDLQRMAKYQGFGDIKVIIDENAPPY